MWRDKSNPYGHLSRHRRFCTADEPQRFILPISDSSSTKINTRDRIQRSENLWKSARCKRKFKTTETSHNLPCREEPLSKRPRGEEQFTDHTSRASVLSSDGWIIKSRLQSLIRNVSNRITTICVNTPSPIARQFHRIVLDDRMVHGFLACSHCFMVKTFPRAQSYLSNLERHLIACKRDW